MTGGIGDFSVSAGQPIRIPGSIPQGARLHYIVMNPGSMDRSEPLRFHNGLLDDIKGRFRASAQVPLPELPGFFPAGATGDMTFQGRDIFHLDSALRGQPLFSQLEALRILVQKAAGRRLAFPEFVSEINRIPIPAEWRNEIVNSLFDNAQSPPAAPQGGQSGQSKVGKDLQRILEMFQEGDGGGTAVNPNLGRFLDEVGRDSTGFILKDGAAKALFQDLTKTLESLRGGLLRHGALSSVLGFLASLQRLARLAKGRDRQTVHLWSDVPDDVGSVLAADGDGSVPDAVQALVLIDAFGREAAFLRRVAGLAQRLECPLLIQLPGEAFPEDGPGAGTLAALDAGLPAQAFFFAGGVASLVDGDAHVFRPAALAFLEGLVAARQPVSAFLHRSMVLEDQDVITEKGQARAADRLLDQTQIDALAQRRVNRVNSVRNRTEAVFPLLSLWKDQ